MNDKYKAKLRSYREKKEYQEKVRLMKNHILAMKKQQEDMDKKIKFLKHKEENIINVKKDRENTKKAILEYNNNKKDEIEQKRKNIEKQREIMNKGIKESNLKIKMDKINNYKQLQKERQEVNDKIHDNKEKRSSKIKNQIEKIKMLRENNKNLSLKRKKILNENYNDLNEKKYEDNLEETKLLKLQIKQLQTEEDEFLNKLNRTKERLNTYSSAEKIFFGNSKKRKSRKSEKVSMTSIKNKSDNE